MHSDEMLAELSADFPELKEEGVNLQKEVFAHFGLTFMGLALVEHGLINLFTFIKSAEYFFKSDDLSQENWESMFDKAFDEAKLQTFGSLKKKITSRKEFKILENDLLEVKKLRDYFAHHFMREESQYLTSQHGCIFLIYNMGKIRKRIKAIEETVDRTTEEFFRKFGLPEITSAYLGDSYREMTELAEKQLNDGTAKVGWAFDAL